MTRRRWIVALTLTLAGGAPWVLQSRSKERLWQEGELISRRTVPAGRTWRRQYIYRIRAGSIRYLVTSAEPLTPDLHVPMKLAVGRRSIFIQDADGREHKLSMLQRSARAPRF